MLVCLYYSFFRIHHIWKYDHLKFLIWSSTPVRCRQCDSAWLYMRACVDEPQFTSVVEKPSLNIRLTILFNFSIHKLLYEQIHQLNMEKIRLHTFHSFCIMSTKGRWNTWFLVADINVECQNNDVGKEGSPPVDDKHNHTAQHSSRQWHPLIVVFKTWTPSWLVYVKGNRSQKSATTIIKVIHVYYE